MKSCTISGINWGSSPESANNVIKKSLRRHSCEIQMREFWQTKNYLHCSTIHPTNYLRLNGGILNERRYSRLSNQHSKPESNLLLRLILHKLPLRPNNPQNPANLSYRRDRCATSFLLWRDSRNPSITSLLPRSVESSRAFSFSTSSLQRRPHNIAHLSQWTPIFMDHKPLPRRLL